jgi:NADH-quinone oxidoreductase subunit C
VSVEAPIAPPVDSICQQYLDALGAELGEAVLDSVVQKHDLFVRVRADAWVATLATCKSKLGLTYFCFLSGLDWLVSEAQTTRYENVWGSVEEESEPSAEAESPEADALAPPADDIVPAGLVTGLAGGTSRFQVFARVYSTQTRRGVVIKADLDETSPTVDTITNVYAGADWHERETWEMYGFWFNGHANLSHLYLPLNFEGYPLRKDFPLLAREVKPWPGLTNVEPIAGAADDEAAEAS